MKTLRIILFMFAVCLIACFVGSFFKNAQASTDAHKKCFYTHTCRQNYTYADGHVTVNGTVVATATVKTPVATHQTSHSKKYQVSDSDSQEIQKEQEEWNNNEEKRIGDENVPDTYSPYTQVQPTMPVQSVETPKQPFLTIVSQMTGDSAVCYVRNCQIDITRLAATNGLYIMVHVIGQSDVNILILKYGNGYQVNTTHLSDITVMKQGYVVNVY